MMPILTTYRNALLLPALLVVANSGAQTGS